MQPRPSFFAVSLLRNTLGMDYFFSVYTVIFRGSLYTTFFRRLFVARTVFGQVVRLLYNSAFKITD